MVKPKLKGVILAGGQGTRFRPLTYYFQKCMIPVGEEQRPVLEYIVRLFSHYEINDLILLVGYKFQQVKNYFNEGDRFGVKLRYVLDHPKYKGNANAIINAYRQGDITHEDCIIVYYGDILSDFNLKKMVAQHNDSGASATVALAHRYKVRVGTAEIENGLITKFHEKPELETPVSVGIIVLGGTVLEEMNQIFEENNINSFDLMGDVIPYLIKNDFPVGAYLSDAFWYDLGSLERYEKFESEKMVEKLSYLRLNK